MEHLVSKLASQLAKFYFYKTRFNSNFIYLFIYFFFFVKQAEISNGGHTPKIQKKKKKNC